MTLWQELRRRQMFRLTGLYIVGAWLVMQVADILFPVWGIPETAIRYLIYAAFLCFPIALVFGWVFDVTKDGIFRTKRAGADELVDFKLQKADYGILTALTAVGLLVLLGSAEKIQEQVEDTPVEIEARPNSVAVLPFENLDDNSETAYFSDGVTEEILTRLSSLGGLHVTSRNSSFMFRNSSAEPGQITSQLGVRYLLLGSVRRHKNLVRITARLIDFQGFQLWADSYDRDFSHILDVQSEIATTVSSHIATEITQSGADRLVSRSIDPEAYDAYLFARALIHARTADWHVQAEEVLEKAISLEPDYAPPHALLSIVLSFSGGFETRSDRITELTSRALELDPELAEAHLAVGFQHLLNSENEEAIESFRRTLKLDPSLTMAYAWLASALDGANRVDEMLAVRRAGLAVDPLNPILVSNMASWHYARGEQQQAERLYLRVANAPQPAWFVYFQLIQFYDRTGQLDEAMRWLKQMARDGRDAIPDLTDQDIAGYLREFAFTYLRLGEFSKAADWHEFALVYDPHGPAADIFRFYSPVLQGHAGEATKVVNAVAEAIGPLAQELDADTRGGLGLSHVIVGQYERGIELLEQVASVDALAGERSFGQKSDALDHILYLAFAFQQTNRDDEAIALLVQTSAAVEALLAEGSNEDSRIYHALALTRGLLDDPAGARHALGRAVELGWIDYHYAVNDTMWARAFRGEDVATLLADVKAELDRQQAVVADADAASDFRAEFEEILAAREPRQ